MCNIFTAPNTIEISEEFLPLAFRGVSMSSLVTNRTYIAQQISEIKATAEIVEDGVNENAWW